MAQAPCICSAALTRARPLAQTTFLQETAFSMFKASMQTDLEHQKTAMKRDCDAVRTECDKLRTGAARARGESPGCC